MFFLFKIVVLQPTRLHAVFNTFSTRYFSGPWTKLTAFGKELPPTPRFITSLRSSPISSAVDSLSSYAITSTSKAGTRPFAYLVDNMTTWYTCKSLGTMLTQRSHQNIKPRILTRSSAQVTTGLRHSCTDMTLCENLRHWDRMSMIFRASVPTRTSKSTTRTSCQR
jgi:hypothetical protein